METVFITRKLSIPLSELEWTYVRSSGPGGQNVNRTNSCAVLRWNYLESPSLHSSILLTPDLTEKFESLCTREGDLIIRCQSFRDQERNYQECLTRFKRTLEKVFHKPKPRIPTKPTRSSQRKRLNEKKQLSEKKSFRKKDLSS